MFGLNFKHALLSDVHTPHHWLEMVIEGNDAEKPAAEKAGRLYWATDTHILYKDNGTAWVELWRAEDVIDHGSIQGLVDDDHILYYNQTRGDARYQKLGISDEVKLIGYDYTNSLYQFLAVDPASKAVKFVGVGGNGGVTDHGELTGLGDDDHTQYVLKTKSYGAGNAFARAYTLTAQVMANGVKTKIQLNLESYDPGGNFNTGTYRFTAPVSGYYHIMGQTSWEDEFIGDGDVFETLIARNGVANYFLSSNEASPSTDSTDVNPIVNDIRHLTAADYLEMYGVAYRATGDGKLRSNLDSDNFMTVWLVKAD